MEHLIFAGYLVGFFVLLFVVIFGIVWLGRYLEDKLDEPWASLITCLIVLFLFGLGFSYIMEILTSEPPIRW